VAIKDKLRRQKDGSYILNSKAKESKQGDCVECGENSTTRSLLFRYNPEDLKLVKGYIESQLSRYSTTEESITPVWCNTCKSLIKYLVNVNVNK
tara:strand:- start:330 stop:611 length:282 start_codon:yes stop_codon:yes gene_type:complete